MRVILLRGAYDDLVWFRRYYKTVFPEGAARATRHYREALERLADMPLVGRPVPDRPVHIHAVSRTPFVLIYRVVDDRVEVLRVWDARAGEVEGWIGDGD